MLDRFWKNWLNNIKRLPFIRAGKTGNPSPQKSRPTATFYFNGDDAEAKVMAKVPIISGTFKPMPMGESKLLKVPSIDIQAAPATTKSLSRFDLRSISPASEIDLVRMSALEKIHSKSMSCLASDIDVDKDGGKSLPAPTPTIVVDKVRRRSHEVGGSDLEKKTLAKKKLGHRRSHSAAILLPTMEAGVGVGVGVGVDLFGMTNVEKRSEVRRSSDAIYATPSASSKTKSSTFPRSMSPVLVSSPAPTPRTPNLGKKLLKSMSVPVKHFLDVATLRYLPRLSEILAGILASWTLFVVRLCSFFSWCRLPTSGNEPVLKVPFRSVARVLFVDALLRGRWLETSWMKFGFVFCF